MFLACDIGGTVLKKVLYSSNTQHTPNKTNHQLRQWFRYGSWMNTPKLPVGYHALYVDRLAFLQLLLTRQNRSFLGRLTEAIRICPGILSCLNSSVISTMPISSLGFLR